MAFRFIQNHLLEAEDHLEKSNSKVLEAEDLHPAESAIKTDAGGHRSFCRIISWQKCSRPQTILQTQQLGEILEAADHLADSATYRDTGGRRPSCRLSNLERYSRPQTLQDP